MISYDTVDRLNAEWRCLTDSPDTDSRLHLWADQCPVLATASNLDVVLEVVSAQPDLVLGYLIGVGQAGDQFALRVVMQATLKGLLRRAGGRVCYDDALSFLWETIQTYPLARRPSSIAANVLLDTMKRARRQLAVATSAADDPSQYVGHYDFDPTAAFGELEWTTGRLLRAAVELQLLPPSALALLEAITEATPAQTLKVISEGMGIAPITNRQRYHRLVALLRENQSELIEHEADLFAAAA